MCESRRADPDGGSPPHPPDRGVEHHAVALEIDPHRRDVRRSVPVQRRKVPGIQRFDPAANLVAQLHHRAPLRVSVTSRIVKRPSPQRARPPRGGRPDLYQVVDELVGFTQRVQSRARAAPGPKRAPGRGSRRRVVGERPRMLRRAKLARIPAGLPQSRLKALKILRRRRSEQVEPLLARTRRSRRRSCRSCSEPQRRACVAVRLRFKMDVRETMVDDSNDAGLSARGPATRRGARRRQLPTRPGAVTPRASYCRLVPASSVGSTARQPSERKVQRRERLGQGERMAQRGIDDASNRVADGSMTSCDGAEQDDRARPGDAGSWLPEERIVAHVTRPGLGVGGPVPARCARSPSPRRTRAASASTAIRTARAVARRHERPSSRCGQGRLWRAARERSRARRAPSGGGGTPMQRDR